MILKPGTGTNPYYARKHGHEIPNVLDKVLAGLCPDYQPTGARNSIDAAEMLCKGERIEFAGTSRPRSSQPTPKTYPATPSNQTFGSHAPAAPLPVTLPAPRSKPPVALADLDGILASSYGWSEQDSQRQLQALKHCPGISVQAVTREAFNQSVDLADKAFGKTGWSAALTTASILAGVGAVWTAFSNPGLALGLATGALAGAGGSAVVLSSSRKDSNNSEILSDLGRRIDAVTWGHNYDRHGSHGNYSADFTP